MKFKTGPFVAKFYRRLIIPPMKAPPPKTPFSLVLTGWFLALAGWGWLVAIRLNLVPFNPGTLWLFYALWFIGLTGTAMPFVLFLNRRFARALPAEKVVLRQSIWVGLFGTICLWLQIPRILNLIAALLIAAALIAIETFLLLRARSQWRPDDGA